MNQVSWKARTRRGRIALVSALLCVAGIATSCGDADDPFGALAAQLEGETWRLVAVRPRSSSVAFIPDNAAYNISLTSGGTWSGVNSCNTCTGTYTLGSQQKLSFGAISCTEMACPNPPTWIGYDVALAMVTSFEFENDRLLLIYTDRAGETWEMIHNSGE